MTNLRLLDGRALELGAEGLAEHARRLGPLPGGGWLLFRTGWSARGDDPALHYMLGCSFQAQMKVEDAVASFARALELDPGFAKAHNNRGWTLEMAGNLEAAMQAYQRAGELDPNLAVAFYNRGNLFRRLGDAAFSMSNSCPRQRRLYHRDQRIGRNKRLFQNAVSSNSLRFLFI